MICKDRVVIVTGAGRGLGRAHALAFARAGARVVVNDIGATLAGADTGEDPAADVVAEIEAMGGEGLVSHHDVADFDAAGDLVQAALERWGRLDVVVNNAGVLRDGMFYKARPDDWDLVMRVHLRGHYAVARHASMHWRDLAKRTGEPTTGRIINTSSGAGIQGSVGQAAYSAAKGGIASLTLVQAAELGRYGVTANSIAPVARTRMTEAVFADMMKKGDGFDAMAPENVSPLLVWLGSEEAQDVSGRLFEVAGGKIILSDGWRPAAQVDKFAQWEPQELGSVIRGLLEEAPQPMPVYGAR